MKNEALIVTSSETEQFLQEKYGSNIAEVKKLGSGAWSHAFSFVNGKDKNVIRWSDMSDNFERDAHAASFDRDGLPIPQIIDFGRGLNKFFAISPFVDGTFLETLSESELDRATPSILKMVRALRSVDLSTASGFGFWNKDGKGSYSSWKEFLLDDKNKSQDSLIKGWKANLENSSMGTDAYERLWGKCVPLVEKCPEDRSLVHSDLINRNVLTAGSNISAVLDWGSSFYGDSLYDIAWFMFYEPWYPNFRKVNVPQKLLEGFKADPTTNKVNIDNRMLCYMLHIGLDSIAYNSFKEDWKHAQEAADYTLKILK